MNTPIGYSLAVPFQCIIITYAFSALMTTVSIGIGNYLFGMSLTDDIKTILHSIDKNSKSRKNRQNLRAQFIEFINLHSDTKQLSYCISIKIYVNRRSKVSF